jgi:hypothetical protein
VAWFRTSYFLLGGEETLVYRKLKTVARFRTVPRFLIV